jgi:hypothetical protein
MNWPAITKIASTGVPVQTALITGGLLLLVFGFWFAWRRYWRSLAKSRPGAEAVGGAFWNLALIALMAPSLLTDVSLNAWSAEDKAIGAGLLALLFVEGVQIGMALNSARQWKAGVGQA